MANTTVLLVRHADVHNPAQLVYGRLPRFRLSTDGLAQAEMTAKALTDEPIAAFYSSPMLRARQTTRLLAQYHPGVPVRYSRLLTEVGTSWQGTRWADMAKDVNLYEPRKSQTDESMEDVADRMERLVRRLVRQYRGQTVACVSHADPIMIAKVRLLGRELTLQNIREPDYPERASVTRLTFTPEGTMQVSYASPAQALIKQYQTEAEAKPTDAADAEQDGPDAAVAS